MRRTGLAMATILGALCLGCPGRAVAQRQNFTFGHLEVEGIDGDHRTESARNLM